MPRRSAIVRSERAGSLEPVRLGVRWADDAASAALFGEGWLVPGSVEVGPFRLRVGVDAEGEAATYEVLVRNAGDRPLYLIAVVLGFRWRGVDVSHLRFLRHGWQSWSFSGACALGEVGDPPFPSGPWLRGMMHAVGQPPADRAGWHESDLLTVIGASRSGAACVAGALERGTGFGVVYARREGSDVRVEVEVRLEVPLAPGESREVEGVRAALGTDPYRLLEEHAREHGRVAGARTARSLPTGWCTWYHFFHDLGEDDVRRNLDALAAGRDELPVDLVQIDDGWQRAIGDWLETNEKFPRGIAVLAEEIRAAGFTPGLWTAPFCVAPESRLFAEHPEWLLREGDGFFRGLHHAGWSKGGWIHVLDATLPAVCEHLEGIYRELVETGFAYQKLDFLFTQAMQADAHDPRLTRAQRLRRGLEAVRAGCGEGAFLLGCGCPLGAAVGVVDAMRIGPDVAPSWQPDLPVAIPGLEPTLPSTRNAVRNVLARAFLHRRLWLNDPDCLIARSREAKLSPDEARTLAAAIGATGGMPSFSDDLASLDVASRALVAETIALAHEVDGAAPEGTARALDLLEGEIAAGVAARTLSGGVLALINAGEETRVHAVDLGALGWSSARMEPLLGAQASPVIEGSHLRVELAPHASVVQRLRGSAQLAVFCDFDGTFLVQDVGSALARRYRAEHRPAAWARYERGEISAWEYNLEVLDGLRVPEAELEAFLQSVELDPGAADLVAWCELRGVPFRVLSDGFDRNLDRIQEIHRVRFRYDANRLRIENGAFHIEAGHPDSTCHCGTGTCKRGRIAAYRAEHPEAVIVHIGNGRVSDLCAAEVADVTFAKDTLAEELAARGRRFHSFATLRDVIAGLERLWGHHSRVS